MDQIFITKVRANGRSLIAMWWNHSHKKDKNKQIGNSVTFLKKTSSPTARKQKKTFLWGNCLPRIIVLHFRENNSTQGHFSIVWNRDCCTKFYTHMYAGKIPVEWINDLHQGTTINHKDMEKGGGRPNVHITYFVEWSMMDHEGGRSVNKSVNIDYGLPLNT